MENKQPLHPSSPSLETGILHNSYAMARTDSAVGEDFDMKRFSAGGSDRNRSSSTSQSYETDIRSFRPATSSGPTHTNPRDHHRKHSVATLPSRQHRSSASRSSSINSHRRGDRPRPGRINSSPVPTMTNPNIEDAIAFHERSCRLMETFNRTHDVIYTQPYQPEYVPNNAYYALPPAVQPQAYYPTYPSPQTESTVHLDSPSPVEADTESHQPVMHWTSTSTRRKEYAEIDKRNRGLRKWMRKFVPGCLSRADSNGFYCEKDGSDAGSVRRYRLDLPDDEKD